MMCLKKRFQKSRAEAICDGDRNTRIFHLSTLIRRRKNRIEALQNSAGEWITDYQEVKKLVFDYWFTLFQESANYSSTTRLLWDYFPEMVS